MLASPSARAQTPSSSHLCHICGTIFPKSSLPIHQKQCIRKFRRPDSAASAPNLETNMYPCTKCKSYIPYHKMSSHLRTCNTTSSSSSSLGRPTPSPAPSIDEGRSMFKPMTAPAHGSKEYPMLGLRVVEKPLPEIKYEESEDEQEESETEEEGEIDEQEEEEEEEEYEEDEEEREEGDEPEKLPRSQESKKPLVQDPSHESYPPAPPIYEHLDVERQECSGCNRKFAIESLPRHMKMCQSRKPRKVFDVRKQRLQGTELAKFSGSGLNGNGKIGSQEEPLKKRSTWRHKHQQLMDMVQSAKSDDPPKSASSTSIPSKNSNSSKLKSTRTSASSKARESMHSSYPPGNQAAKHDDGLTPCPCCNRRFNPDVAERHIPVCQDSKRKAQFKIGSSRPSNRSSKSSLFGEEESEKKESRSDMLKKRTLYKPPVLKKRKDQL